MVVIRLYSSPEEEELHTKIWIFFKIYSQYIWIFSFTKSQLMAKNVLYTIF